MAIIAIVNLRVPPGLCLAVVLYGVMAVVGMGWGLPTTRLDVALFGDGPVWSGRDIARLSSVSSRSDGTRAADVDADPVVFDGPAPVDLTASEQSIAAIYRRYRLFTQQPDEMITMMALAGLRPRELQLDPRLYQYGGLFVYPVGACIGLSGTLGLISVTADLAYYLDHPDDFGGFYVVARGYVAAWGLIGVALVHAIASRMAGRRAGCLAALLAAAMPIVICMSHEAKPHLPGAVLMLAAVWLAMRYVDRGRGRDWWAMCAACGAAMGMVLSSLPIFVLIPLVEPVRRRRPAQHDSQRDRTARAPTWRDRNWWGRVLCGLLLASGVYLVTNPYVAVNAVSNREVLLSNLSNSTAMYEVGRVGDGLLRVMELTAEGTTLPLAVLGLSGLLFAAARRAPLSWLLVAPCGLLFAQFVLLGAGKPAEYGRFGVFIDIALAILAAGILTAWGRDAAKRSVRYLGRALCVVTVLATAWGGWGYLRNFVRAGDPGRTRERANLVAQLIASHDAADEHPVVCVLADPAPYCLPPLDFSRVRVWRYPSLDAYLADPKGILVVPSDSTDPRRSGLPAIGTHILGASPVTPISWANKPIMVYTPPRSLWQKGTGTSPNSIDDVGGPGALGASPLLPQPGGPENPVP